ncbi:MAG: hypothetical protein JNL32_09820 [Candidatus Kapabacteria bacterium]|nr:hypothetical protein [Candidatus Kapabacteria bacterium]
MFKNLSFEKFIYYFSLGLYFLGNILIIFEIDIIDNTVHGTELFWQSAFVGLAIATVITVILKLIKPSVYENKASSVHFGFYLGFCLLIPTMASFVNHTYADIDLNYRAYDINSKGTDSRNRNFWLHLKLDDNSEEQFVVKRNLYNKVSGGDQIILCLRKGRLGYYVVEDLKTLNEGKYLLKNSPK